jgi:hypothetical protein
MSSYVTFSSISNPVPSPGKSIDWSEMRPAARFVPSLHPTLAMCPRMDFPRSRHADRVRQILSTRGLTFYRASHLSAQMFGRSSAFYLPRNLYHRLAASAVTPGIYQLLALSRITNYRLSDWLGVFGFDLEVIPQLQALVPRRRTVVLDSSVYDRDAWVTWFADRPGVAVATAIAPLGQLVSRARPKRARELLAHGKSDFLYAKVGYEDLLAFPDVGPGSIVRIDTRQAKQSPSLAKDSADQRIFLLEHDAGFACSRLASLGNGRVVFRSPQLPFAEGGFSLGKDLRILGVVDAEVLRVPHHGGVAAQFAATAAQKGPRLARNNTEMNLKQLIRRSRVRAGFSFRDASKTTEWMAQKLRDPLYFTAASTLSDYETLSAAPRHMQKILALCVVYAISFGDFLRASGLAFDEAESEPIPDEFSARERPLASHTSHAANVEQNSRKQNGLLSHLLKRWEEVPLFLRRSVGELTRVPNFSVSDVFWVGGDPSPIHPWLEQAEFVAINRRVRKPAASRDTSFWERPLYLLLTRDGRYLCGSCTLERGFVAVHPYPDRPFGPRQFKNGSEAEIVGEVTTILRRLNSSSQPQTLARPDMVGLQCSCRAKR